MIFCIVLLSLPVWGEWIEMYLRKHGFVRKVSLSVWGEWIEIRNT